MSNLDVEFLMELFLDDNVSTVNRLVVATANVINENLENISFTNDVLMKENNQFLPSRRPLNGHTTTRRRNFFERDLKKCTEQEFIEKFKMRRSTVQALISFLNDYARPASSIVPLEKKVHMFLWLLVNDSSFKEVGEIFGLHKSSVSYIFHEIATWLSEQRYQYINWPSFEEQQVTRVKVNSKCGFPNCVGFIDTCCLKVGSKRKRKEQPEIILLQAVCDESLMFIDIHIGDIGDTNKNRVFKESSLAKELKNFIDFDNHILGDSEYKLRKNLITPFISEEVITSDEMRFNAVHWKAHTYIRQAFEILKERFKKLNHIDITKPEGVNTLICAVCVLHNFVLLHEGSPVKEETVSNDDGITMDTNNVNTAIEKRQFLCNYINYIQNSNNSLIVNT